MEKTIIISTAYYPPISYLQEIRNANKVIIEAHENYNRQTYRNRCEILSCNGKLTLSIPIKKTSVDKIPIKEIEIDNSTRWQKIHYYAIKSAYGKSPFYTFYEDILLTPLLGTKYDSLFELNNNVLNSILSILKIEADISFSESYKKSEINILDYRESFHPKKKQNNIVSKTYIQTFNDRFHFIPNLSILDLVFNTGPDSILYL